MSRYDKSLVPEHIYEFARKQRKVGVLFAHIKLIHRFFGSDVKLVWDHYLEDDCCCGRHWVTYILYIWSGTSEGLNALEREILLPKIDEIKMTGDWHVYIGGDTDSEQSAA